MCVCLGTFANTRPLGSCQQRGQLCTTDLRAAAPPLQCNGSAAAALWETRIHNPTIRPLQAVHSVIHISSTAGGPQRHPQGPTSVHKPYPTRMIHSCCGRRMRIVDALVDKPVCGHAHAQIACKLPQYVTNLSILYHTRASPYQPYQPVCPRCSADLLDSTQLCTAAATYDASNHTQQQKY